MRRFVTVLVALTACTVLLLVGARGWFAPGDLAATDPRRGREVFWGRGACSGCHSLMGEGGGARGPAFGAGLIDRSGDLTHYLVQSLYQPEAFVVPGYPAGLMPPVHLPPLSLDDDDILGVLAYLWSVTRPGEEPPYEPLRRAQRRFSGGPRDQPPRASGDPGRGRVAYHRLGCRACHRLSTAASEGAHGDRLGPDLNGIGSYQSAPYLAESVVEPNAVLVPGWAAEDGRTSRMPTYALVLEPGELEDLVAFLQTSR